MEDLLITLNVKFQKEYFHGRLQHTARGGGLAEFLDTFTDQERIKESFANIDYYLRGGEFEYINNTINSELYTAWLDNFTADIYPSTGNTENLLQSIPLKEFETVLKLWLKFLST